jgi:NAD(P)-dependent dehydrogenase (short-subunit alcohol dehydrogenase family)
MGGMVSGQKVLISGAAQGLGAAAASALACDGARVLLTDINEAGSQPAPKWPIPRMKAVS